MSARKLVYGERVYQLLLRLSPDVPMTMRELGHCVYYGTPDTVDGKTDRHAYRMRMMLDYARRRLGWDIQRHNKRRGGGGYLLGRGDYLLVRAAFGYCRDLGRPRLDWRACKPLTPGHVQKMLTEALREEAFDATRLHG